MNKIDLEKLHNATPEILALIETTQEYTRNCYRPEAKYDLGRFRAMEMTLAALKEKLNG